jgi:hypothetical protein
VTAQEILRYAWRVSPAATAATLSREDPTPWQPADHLLLLSRAVRDATTGKGPRFLIVNMPPRHGKSWFLSKWCPVWYLENWPHKQVMLCGYGSNFAADWGRAVRNTVEQHKGRLCFELSEDSKAANRWRTNKNGGMVTAGVGGDITGKGADLLIIDDPVKNAEEANSKTYRDNVWSWWTSTARTRLEPGGVIIIIMTRWHEDDLVGRLLNPEYNADWASWHQINLPAICDTKEPDLLGRTEGDALWPERYNKEELAQIKRSVGEADWFSLFQQMPSRMSGVGNVYHGYSDRDNVARCERDPNTPLVWSLDFNVNPMCSVIAQYREQNTKNTFLTNQKLLTVEILREQALPNSNTREACQAFVNAVVPYVNLARGSRIPLEIYGDASGNQGSTKSMRGAETDYIIIREFFERYPEFRVSYFGGRDNPAVKDRTNAVNEALKSADGFRRLMIDPSCTGLRKDFREVKWKTDSGGNTTGVIDKSDAKISHLSDAVGYFLSHKFGIKTRSGERTGQAQ